MMKSRPFPLLAFVAGSLLLCVLAQLATGESSSRSQVLVAGSDGDTDKPAAPTTTATAPSSGSSARPVVRRKITKKTKQADGTVRTAVEEKLLTVEQAGQQAKNKLHEMAQAAKAAELEVERDCALVFPATGVLSSMFEPREDVGFHWGIDIANDEPGVSVYAPADGTITDVNDSCPDSQDPECGQTRGNYVSLKFTEDQIKGFVGHLYHFKKGSLTVKPGDKVTRGSELGKMGSSGHSSGSHSHFEIGIGSYEKHTNSIMVNPCSGATRDGKPVPAKLNCPAVRSIVQANKCNPKQTLPAATVISTTSSSHTSPAQSPLLPSSPSPSPSPPLSQASSRGSSPSSAPPAGQ